LSEVTIEVRKKILEMVEKKPSTLQEIMTGTGLTRGAALGHMAFLRKQGLIEEDEKRMRYLITEEGRRALRPPPTISLEAIKTILSMVPPGKGFYFYTDIGKYTGLLASSLAEFCDMVKIVDVRSLEFHLYRGDFEYWIRDTLKDEVLASEVSEIKKLALKGEELRLKMYNVLKERYDELKRALQ